MSLLATPLHLTNIINLSYNFFVVPFVSVFTYTRWLSSKRDPSQNTGIMNCSLTNTYKFSKLSSLLAIYLIN